MSEILKRQVYGFRLRAMLASRLMRAERGSAKTPSRHASMRFALSRLRSTRWLSRVAILATLLIPVQAVAFQGIAIAMLIDGPTIMCRADGGLDIVRDDGTTEPVGALHDCCSHCLAASAPPLSGAVVGFTAHDPDPRLHATMSGVRGIQFARQHLTHVYARGPPSPSHVDHAGQHAPLGPQKVEAA